MSYTPLDSDFLTSTLLKEGPLVVAVFTIMMASQDRLGETAITASAIASLLRISDEEAERAFERLSEPDPKSRNREHGGRRIIDLGNGRWKLVSHEKYQAQASVIAAKDRRLRYEERQKDIIAQAAGVFEATKITCFWVGPCGERCEAEVPIGAGLCEAHFGLAFDEGGEVLIEPRGPGVEG